MNRIQKVNILLILNLIMFYTIDLIFGLYFPPIEYLNTKNQYLSNYRNYFIKSVDHSGRTIFIPEKIEIDLTHSQTTFLKNSLKVMGIGDSFTQGQGVKSTDTWIKKIENNSLGKRIYGMNYGKSGADIKQIKSIFDASFENNMSDVVVYGLVLNDIISNATVEMKIDIDNINNYQSDVGLYFDLINTRTNVFDKNRDRFLDLLSRSSHIANYIIKKYEINKVAENSVLYYRNLLDDNKNKLGLDETFKLINEINLKVKSKKKRFIVMIFPLLFQTNKNYPFEDGHATLRSRLSALSIETIDLIPAFRQFDARDLWVHPIDQHPNDFAHQVAADQLLNYIFKN